MKFFFIFLFLIFLSPVRSQSEGPDGTDQIESVTSSIGEDGEDQAEEEVAPEDQVTMRSDVDVLIVTGKPETSTLAQNDSTESWQKISVKVEVDLNTQSFDFERIETGAPEPSTIEPYMPKPKPQKNQEAGEEPELGSGFGGSGSGSGDVIIDGSGEGVTSYTDSYSSMEVSDVSHWTTRKIKDLTVSQRIDEDSPGYSQLLKFLKDLNTRRDATISVASRTKYFLESTNQSTEHPGITNITNTQVYIQDQLAKASEPVQQAYSDIIALSSTPDFYYIPKKQRFLMVNKVISDLPTSHQDEIEAMNEDVKIFCKHSNVDTPPYTMGNIYGNKLGNGAILTK